MAIQEAPSCVSVPFLDLSPMHRPLREALLRDIGELLDGGAFTNGPAVQRFEEAFADYCGVEHCIGLASGLDALRLGLAAMGLEPGAEVVVPALTFVATAEAVVQAGGVPVLADISPDDYCLDPGTASVAISPRTQAIVPVHIYGQMADMATLSELSANRGVGILEDACQAHGAERNGLRAGASAGVAAFSFYPGKNLGGAGDAGALTTSSGEIATLVRALREHGQTAKYQHSYEGWTARLDTIQAVVLGHKLSLLDEWNAQRRAVAGYYEQALADVGDLVLPRVATGSRPVWHLYVVRTADPEGLATFLRERSVGTGRHYPDPVHLTGAYSRLGYRRGQFPVAEQLAQECLSLPMFPGISEAQLEAVTRHIKAFFDG